MATGTSGSSDSFDRTHAMSALLAQNWWAVALRGVFAIIFALIAFFSPGATILSLVWFFAAYMLVDGVFGIVAGDPGRLQQPALGPADPRRHPEHPGRHHRLPDAGPDGRCSSSP